MPDRELLQTRPQTAQHANADDTVDASSRRYLIVLRRDLQVTEVTRLLSYVADFGTGDARGHERDGGWCLRMSELADVRLLASQCAELIEDLAIEEAT